MTETNAIVLPGGCQCGAVRFIARPTSHDAYYCHCQMCRRAFGAIFATFFNVPKAQVTWESEPSFFSSSRIGRRAFCSKCGTPLSFEYVGGKNMDLAVGALDHPELMKPAMHVSVETRLASFHRPDGLPEKRLEEFEHIGKKWRAAYGDDVVPGPRDPSER